MCRLLIFLIEKKQPLHEKQVVCTLQTLRENYVWSMLKSMKLIEKNLEYEKKNMKTPSWMKRKQKQIEQKQCKSHYNMATYRILNKPVS